MSESLHGEQASAIDGALSAAKRVLAELGARLVKSDPRHRVALVRQVNARTHVGLLAAHLDDAPPGAIAERIATVTLLAGMDAGRFDASIAALTGRIGAAAALDGVRGHDRTDVLLEREQLSWDDLKALVRVVPGPSGAGLHADAEAEAVAHLVSVGLTAVRGDKGHADGLANELRQRAGVELSAAEILACAPGELLSIVRDRARAGAERSDIEAQERSSAQGAHPEAQELPPSLLGPAWSGEPLLDGCVLQWDMSPQAVLRVLLRDAQGVEPPAAVGAPFGLQEGYRFLRRAEGAQGFDELDPLQTDKVLHCDDLVRIVPGLGS